MSNFVIRDVCDAVAKAIRSLEAVTGAGNVETIVEDRGVVETAVEKALSETGVAAVVAATAHTRRDGSGSSLTGTLAIEVRVSERPAVNREYNPSGLTAQDTAEAIGRGLHRTRPGDFGRIIYDGLRRDDTPDENVVFVDLHLEQSVGEGDAVAWGIEGGTAYGEIRVKRIGRGGTPVFEANSRGADEWAGIRNRHTTIDLTVVIPATLAEDIPELGDEFTCPVKGTNTTFFCTLAEVTEQIEDEATLHLAGRTLPGTTP